MLILIVLCVFRGDKRRPWTCIFIFFNHHRALSYICSRYFFYFFTFERIFDKLIVVGSGWTLDICIYFTRKTFDWLKKKFKISDRNFFRRIFQPTIFSEKKKFRPKKFSTNFPIKNFFKIFSKKNSHEKFTFNCGLEFG